MRLVLRTIVTLRENRYFFDGLFGLKAAISTDKFDIDLGFQGVS